MGKMNEKSLEEKGNKILQDFAKLECKFEVMEIISLNLSAEETVAKIKKWLNKK